MGKQFEDFLVHCTPVSMYGIKKNNAQIYFYPPHPHSRHGKSMHFVKCASICSLLEVTWSLFQRLFPVHMVLFLHSNPPNIWHVISDVLYRGPDQVMHLSNVCWITIIVVFRPEKKKQLWSRSVHMQSALWHDGKCRFQGHAENNDTSHIRKKNKKTNGTCSE